MARARNIKPGFFKNEDLAECSPWARLCFAGLWTLADREGRLEDRPKRIKGELFAFDSVEVEPLLSELAEHRFIIRYRAADGRALIQVTEFAKHQNPHHREPESELPGPESPGLRVVANAPKPEAQSGLHEPEAQGKPQASPGLDAPSSDLATGSSRADSGTLIPDTGDTAPVGAVVDKRRPPAIVCPYTEIVGLYHDLLPSLPTVRVLDGKTGDARKKAMREMWGWVLSSTRPDGTRRATTADQAVEWFRAYFTRATENDFVMGRTARGAGHEHWRADLDYLLSRKGLTQVLEKTAA